MADWLISLIPWSYLALMAEWPVSIFDLRCLKQDSEAAKTRRLGCSTLLIGSDNSDYILLRDNVGENLLTFTSLSDTTAPADTKVRLHRKIIRLNFGFATKTAHILD